MGSQGSGGRSGYPARRVYRPFWRESRSHTRVSLDGRRHRHGKSEPRRRCQGCRSPLRSLHRRARRGGGEGSERRVPTLRFWKEVFPLPERRRSEEGRYDKGEARFGPGTLRCRCLVLIPDPATKWERPSDVEACGRCSGSGVRHRPGCRCTTRDPTQSYSSKASNSTRRTARFAIRTQASAIRQRFQL